MLPASSSSSNSEYSSSSSSLAAAAEGRARLLPLGLLLGLLLLPLPLPLPLLLLLLPLLLHPCSSHLRCGCTTVAPELGCLVAPAAAAPLLVARGGWREAGMGGPPDQRGSIRVGFGYMLCLY